MTFSFYFKVALAWVLLVIPAIIYNIFTAPRLLWSVLVSQFAASRNLTAGGRVFILNIDQSRKEPTGPDWKN